MLKNLSSKIIVNRLLFDFFCVLIISASLSYTASAANGKKNSVIKPKVNTVINKARKSDQSQSRQLLVKFRKGTGSAAKNSLHQTIGARIKKSLKSSTGVQVLELDPAQDMDEIIKQYRKNPAVIYAEPNYRINLKAIPNEVRFPQLWGLDNVAQTGGAVDADINAPEAWDFTQGDTSVVVAVLDTGIDYSHEDLVENMWMNPGEIPGNGIDDDGNGQIDDVYGIDTADLDTNPMDLHGHGTHVAGTIGARGNNGIGVTGVNWNVSILACKIFSGSSGGAEDLVGFVSDAIECLDYVRDLKLNYGINIVATNNSWGWIGPQSQALKDAIERQMDAGILFIVAAGNESINNDQFLENPSSYYIPNVISVAASTDRDELAHFSNSGSRTVHVAAPGEDILSTIPGSLPENNVHSNIILDNVESGAIAWNAQGSWARSSLDSISGRRSWMDSPAGNYANNTNASLTSPVIDLSSYEGQSVYLGFYINYEIEQSFEPGVVYDELRVEASSNGVNWINLDTISGISDAWEFVSLTVPPSLLTSTFRFRFRLVTDFTVTMDGVKLDDIGLGTTPFVALPSATSNKYDIFDGTSMASPHVAGLAALIKANDGTLSWDQIRNLIISSGTPRSGLTGNTVSGRRIRAAGTGGRGALTCADQTVLARLQPSTDEYGIEPGDLVNVSMLHINCDAPAGEVSVTINETGSTVTLQDDGTGFDQVAGDGIYSAQIDLDALGRESVSIDFPDSSIVYANTIYNYEPAVPNTYQWREIFPVGQPLFTDNNPGEDYDDETRYFNTPFPIRFANSSVPYDRIAVDSNGYLIMQWLGSAPVEFSIYENFEVPLFGLSNIVAVFWDDLVIDSDPGSNVYWGVLGAAPNRELVITWQNVRAFGGLQQMTFQVVFRENSSEVILNYLDTTSETATNNGTSATAGVQVAPSIGTQLSYNSPALFSETSYRWSMPPGAVNTPTLPVPDPPAVRITPGGGGGSFGLLLLLIFPVWLARKIFYTASGNYN